MELTEEEQEILESVERGEWKPVENMEAEIERYRQMAIASSRMEDVSLKLSNRDILRFQVKAREEGLPVDALMSSVLHKYLNGTL